MIPSQEEETFPEEHAWHEQEEVLNEENNATCGECYEGTSGPCQNPKDNVCYPKVTCPPGTKDKVNCCPIVAPIDCTTEAFVNYSEQEISENSYSPYICFYLPIICLLIYFLYKYFKK